MEKARNEVAQACRDLFAHRLTRGTGGNVSVYDRELGLCAISPSGVEYPGMTAEDIVVARPDGSVADGSLRPSSELGMHLACYRARDDIGAVVHTHSAFATAVACTQRSLPPVSYLIALAGSDRVPCIPYYPFGSAELAEAVSGTFREHPELYAVLLGNHGLTACGKTLGAAFTVAEEIEFVSELYCRASALGGARLLSESEISDAIERFSRYGQ